MPKYELVLGDCVEKMAELQAESIDAIVTDPPYAEIDRPYGRLTEEQWWDLMRGTVAQARRVLKPSGSAVFILQSNSERVGRMRPWLFEFMAWIAREWNMVQDAYWWNHATPPTVHCQRKNGLMRPSVKACVWAGSPDCFRGQDKVLWSPSDSMKACDKEDRALRRNPCGQTMRMGRIAETVEARGGTTPFNLIPMANTNSSTSGGASGHGAATPLDLCKWWVRYLSPVGGTVLDPFAGSGTTGIACGEEGMSFIGIEQQPEYLEIARKRISERWPSDE